VKRSLLACLVLLNASYASAQEPGDERREPTLTNADLQITLSAVKPRILVGEFAKVKAEWLALRHVALPSGDQSVLLDDGTGFEGHDEASRDEGCVLCGVVFLAKGESLTTEPVIGLKQLQPLRGSERVEDLNSVFGFAFSRPGTYFVKVRFHEVESNVVSIEVVEPTGLDADVLAAIRRQMGVLSSRPRGTEGLRERAESLVGEYNGHVYLAPVVREMHVRDPLYGGEFARLSASDFGDSVFAADQALLLARLGRQLIGNAWAIPAYQKVVALYPGRAAALDAEAELHQLQDQSPHVVVEVSHPLWPADGKLARVQVSHYQRGEFKQSPVVLLQSITCDDDCDPDADIQDAEPGKADFAFRLRAKHSPDGGGRTYTIVYSVRLSDGSVTTVETKAVVPYH